MHYTMFYKYLHYIVYYYYYYFYYKNKNNLKVKKKVKTLLIRPTIPTKKGRKIKRYFYSAPLSPPH